MRSALATIVTLALICATLITSCQQQNYHPSEAEQLVNSTLAKTLKIIEKNTKYTQQVQVPQCLEDLYVR